MPNLLVVVVLHHWNTLTTSSSVQKGRPQVSTPDPFGILPLAWRRHTGPGPLSSQGSSPGQAGSTAPSSGDPTDPSPAPLAVERP